MYYKTFKIVEILVVVKIPEKVTILNIQAISYATA